jgi:hypothetical protein
MKIAYLFFGLLFSAFSYSVILSSQSKEEYFTPDNQYMVIIKNNNQIVLINMTDFQQITENEEQEQILAEYQQNANICSICIDSDDATGESDKLVETIYGHWFHAPCLRQWVQTNNSCPCCRHRLDIDVNALLLRL